MSPPPSRSLLRSSDHRWLLSYPHGKGEFSVLGEEGIRSEIDRVHARLRGTYSCRWATVSMPETVAEAERAISRSEELARAALQAAVADEAARRDAFGLGPADREVEELSQTEVEAKAAVMAYRPRTSEETNVKLRWFIEDNRGCMVDDDDLASMLVTEPEVVA